ncbi:hypothetical protein [Desulforhopalus sp. 52FAK]
MTNLTAQKNRFKHHKIIVIFFILIFIGCLTSLYSLTLLKKGVYLDSLTINNLSIEKISLIWVDKLSLQVSRVTFTEPTKVKNKETPLDLNFIRKSLKLAHFFVGFFSDIKIESIESEGRNGRFELSQNGTMDNYSLNLFTDGIKLQSSLNLLADKLSANITELSIKHFNTIAKGNLIFDSTLGKITGTISADIANHLPITVDITADSKEISFKNTKTAKLESIKPVVDLFRLPSTIQRWITTYLSGSSYTLETLEGVVPWSDPAAILTNLIARVSVKDCQYTFAPGLEPIKTSYT